MSFDAFWNLNINLQLQLQPRLSSIRPLTFTIVPLTSSSQMPLVNPVEHLFLR